MQEAQAAQSVAESSLAAKEGELEALRGKLSVSPSLPCDHGSGAMLLVHFCTDPCISLPFALLTSTDKPGMPTNLFVSINKQHGVCIVLLQGAQALRGLLANFGRGAGLSSRVACRNQKKRRQTPLPASLLCMERSKRCRLKCKSSNCNRKPPQQRRFPQ